LGERAGAKLELRTDPKPMPNGAASGLMNIIEYRSLPWFSYRSEITC